MQASSLLGDGVGLSPGVCQPTDGDEAGCVQIGGCQIEARFSGTDLEPYPVGQVQDGLTGTPIDRERQRRAR